MRGIVRTPDTVSGRSRFDGTRLSVRFMLEVVNGGWTDKQILENYPSLEKDDVLYLRNRYKALRKGGRIDVLGDVITMRDVSPYPMPNMKTSRKVGRFFDKYHEHEKEVVEYYRYDHSGTYTITRPTRTGYHDYKFYMRSGTISCRDEWVANRGTNKWFTDINHPNYRNVRFWTDSDNINNVYHDQHGLRLIVVYHEHIYFFFSANNREVKRVVRLETHGIPQGVEVINLKQCVVDYIVNYYNGTFE